MPKLKHLQCCKACRPDPKDKKFMQASKLASCLGLSEATCARFACFAEDDTDMFHFHNVFSSCEKAYLHSVACIMREFASAALWLMPSLSNL